MRHFSKNHNSKAYVSKSVLPGLWIGLAVFWASFFLTVAELHPQPGQRVAQDVADVIFHHGNILTGEGLTGRDLASATPRRVEALAVRDGKILAVGSESEIAHYRGWITTVVDLEGAFALPGFNDAHVHLASGGRNKLEVDLIGVRSLAEMRQRIRVGASQAAPGTWLEGRGWDQTLWASHELPAALPTRESLDSVTNGHPAFFRRVDGHIGIANTAALTAAHIARSTPNPEGGLIDRASDGELSGILRETAMDLVRRVIPAPSPSDRRKAMELALSEAVRSGVTSAQDNSDWEDFLALEELERAGKLPIRVTEWLAFDLPLATLQMQRAYSGDDPLLHTGMLKGFLDGSLGSRTAALRAPYADDPANSGIPQYEQRKLNEMTIARAKAGFQIGFHAIGDRGVGMALDAFAAAESAGFKNLRFRVEHAQVVAPQDFARFRELGVIASMQPNHLLTDMRWAEARLGKSRAPDAYAWKRMLDAGAILAFGTDYPVEPIPPFRGIYAAVTRRDESGKQSYPGDVLTIGQALAAYTIGSAYAEFAEKTKGLLAPGYFADLVVLDRDLLNISPVEILHTRVLRTVVGGRTVYIAESH